MEEKNAIQRLHDYVEYLIAAKDDECFEDCKIVVSITNQNFEIWLGDNMYLGVSLDEISITDMSSKGISYSILDGKYILMGFTKEYLGEYEEEFYEENPWIENEDR